MSASSVLTPQQAKYLEVLQSLRPEETELVLNTLERFQTETVQTNPLSERLAGQTFTDEERLKLELESLTRYFERRRQLLQNSLTVGEVAKLLNSSRQTPHDRMRAQTLLGLMDNGKLRFPVWQFDPEGPSGVIDGLPAVLKALPISDFAKLNWLTKPHPVLDNLTPVEVLQRGEKERVLQEARGVDNP